MIIQICNGHVIFMIEHYYISIKIVCEQLGLGYFKQNTSFSNSFSKNFSKKIFSKKEGGATFLFLLNIFSYFHLFLQNSIFLWIMKDFLKIKHLQFKKLGWLKLKRLLKPVFSNIFLKLVYTYTLKLGILLSNFNLSSF